MSTPTVMEAELHAYVDGLLPEPRRAEIEVYLAAHGEEAQRVRAWSEQNLALHERYDPVLAEAVPARMYFLGIDAASAQDTACCSSRSVDDTGRSSGLVFARL